MMKQRIFAFKDEIKEGDYLVEYQKFHYTRHYLVESLSSDSTECTVIESWRKLIKKKKLKLPVDVLNSSTSYYKLHYSHGACKDVQLVIDSTKCLVGKRHYRRNYSRKRLIHYLKTGREDDENINLTDIPEYLCSCAREKSAGEPLDVVAVDTSKLISLVKKSDHLIYNSSSADHSAVYRSVLVVDIDSDQNKVKVMTLKGSLDKEVGVVEEEVDFRDLKTAHKVKYSSSLSEEDVIGRAKYRINKQNETKENFNSWRNNSHLFVTWCKVGKEYPLTSILRSLRDKHKENTRFPVLLKKSCDDIAKGDHLVHMSSHYLVHNVTDSRLFDAYTLQLGKCVLKKGLKLKDSYYKVDYGEYKSDSPEHSLQKAKETVSSKKWKSSCEFVMEMKCGNALHIDERCLIDNDISIDSRSKISPHILVSEGDHIVVKPRGSTEFHSVLVYKCVGKCKFLVMPRLPGTDSDELDLSQSNFDGEAYRINYGQSLPHDQVLSRARCKAGAQKMEKYSNQPWNFVSWTKVGKTIEMPSITNIPEKEQLFITLNSNIHLNYERIFSLSDIKVGDHIFLNCGPKKIILYREHMLVTECKYSTIFKVAFCLRTYIQESEIDLADHDVYRVNYVEERSSEEAIRRARDKVGKRNFSPWARLWFVTWAKTGFDSVEVSLLKHQCHPESKSGISSFTQLNPGDYLIKRNRFGYCHHYIVLSVESPTQCTVCESTGRKVRKVNLTCIWDKKSQALYFRINYPANVCFKSERSIEHAKTLLCTRDLSLLSNSTRQKFVQYIKTGERKAVYIDELEDCNFMNLELELVMSTSELKCGDHVYRSISNKFFRLVGATHHMLIDVSKCSDGQSVKVLHFQVSRVMFRKGTVVNEEVNPSDYKELYRILYPDRIDPKEAITKLKSHTGTNQTVSYNLFSSNCEHLITGVITGVSCSSQVDQVICKLVKFTRSSLRSHVSKCASHGPREIAIHSSVHKATLVKLAVRAPIIKAASITGVLTLAVSSILELPFLIRNIYKLLRRRKFNDILDVEAKRQIIREIIQCLGVIFASALGAILGQLFIPIPVFGAIIGGLAGVIIGQCLSSLLGWLVAKCVRHRRPVSLPTVLCKRAHPL